MNLQTLFVYYYVISGVLSFLMYWYVLNFSKDKDEMADVIADVTWNTGVDRETVKLVTYALGLLLGFIILPYEIFGNITNLIKRKVK